MKKKWNMLFSVFIIVMMLIPETTYANTLPSQINEAGESSVEISNGVFESTDGYTGKGIFTTGLLEEQVESCKTRPEINKHIKETMSTGMGIEEGQGGAETKHDDTKLQESLTETMQNTMASVEGALGDSCDNGSLGVFKTITNIAKPVVLTSIKPLMSLVQYVQGIALGLIVVMVLIYGYELMFKREDADDIMAFILKLAAGVLGIAFSPYLFQDLLNINNIIVYYISNIQLYTGASGLDNVAQGMGIAVVPMIWLIAPAFISAVAIVATAPITLAATAPLGLALVLAIFIALIMLIIPMLKIMLWWYVRLFTLMLMFICFPLFIVLAMNDATDKIAKNFFRNMVAEMFSQVFFALGLLLVLTIMTNFIPIMLSLNVGIIGSFLFIYVLFNSLATIPELTKSWIGGSDGMGYKGMARSLEGISSGLAGMAMAANRTTKMMKENNENRKGSEEVQGSINKQDMASVDREMGEKEKQATNMSVAEKLIQGMNENKGTATAGGDSAEDQQNESTEEKAKDALDKTEEETEKSATIDGANANQNVQQAVAVGQASDEIKKAKEALKRVSAQMGDQQAQQVAVGTQQASGASGQEANAQGTNGATATKNGTQNPTRQQANGTDEPKGSQSAEQASTTTQSEGNTDGNKADKKGNQNESERNQSRARSANGFENAEGKEKAKAAANILADQYKGSDGEDKLSGNKANELYEKLLGVGSESPTTEDVKQAAIDSQADERQKIDNEKQAIYSDLQGAKGEEKEQLGQKLEALEGRLAELDEKAESAANNFINHANKQGIQFSNQMTEARNTLSQKASDEVMKGLKDGNMSRTEAKETMAADLQKNNPKMTDDQAKEKAEQIMKKYEDSSTAGLSWEAQRNIHANAKAGTLDSKTLKDTVKKDIMHNRGYDAKKADSEAEQIINNSPLNQINQTRTQEKKNTHYDTTKDKEDKGYQKTLEERREKHKPEKKNQRDHNGDSNFNVNGRGGENNYPAEKEVNDNVKRGSKGNADNEQTTIDSIPTQYETTVENKKTAEPQESTETEQQEPIVNEYIPTEPQESTETEQQEPIVNEYIPTEPQESTETEQQEPIVNEYIPTEPQESTETEQQTPIVNEQIPTELQQSTETEQQESIMDEQIPTEEVDNDDTPRQTLESVENEQYVQAEELNTDDKYNQQEEIVVDEKYSQKKEETIVDEQDKYSQPQETNEYDERYNSSQESTNEQTYEKPKKEQKQSSTKKKMTEVIEEHVEEKGMVEELKISESTQPKNDENFENKNKDSNTNDLPEKQD